MLSFHLCSKSAQALAGLADSDRHTAGAAQPKPTCNWARSHPVGGMVAGPCQPCHRRSTIKLYQISTISNLLRYGGSETSETGALTDDPTR